MRPHDTYYRLVGSAGGYERIKLVGAAGTSLESSAGTTFTSGDTLYHGIVGTQATFKKNGVRSEARRQTRRSQAVPLASVTPRRAMSATALRAGKAEISPRRSPR
jgi:hypothetical protein